ncbi:tropomodulin-4 isoform X3 [Agelaius phoeniceus]|uniref:tropomodulin-4 isoform X3 n=1 Tax=Agelaius phoeniceus TaxID=39638 RepID=UPI004054CD49
MTPYRQELEKYRDIDEDKILQELSPEELAQLDAELAEMDPENVLLPAGLRQRDQTHKSPTGPLDRDALLQHLERQALEAEERQDLVPFTGEKKGKPFVPKAAAPALPREEQVTLEPELEEALANATDAEMCDIAAILGMYTLMSNKQYYDAICSGNICNTEGINRHPCPHARGHLPGHQDQHPRAQPQPGGHAQQRPGGQRGGRDAGAEPEPAEPQPRVQLHHQRGDAAAAGGHRALPLAERDPPGQPVPAPGGHGGDGAVTVTLTLSPMMSPQCQRLGDTVEMGL